MFTHEQLDFVSSINGNALDPNETCLSIIVSILQDAWMVVHSEADQKMEIWTITITSEWTGVFNLRT